MNTNLIHNILNILGVIVAAFLTFDWASLGLSAETTAMIAVVFIWADKIIKLVMNVLRDGLGGLAKIQPPVQ